MVPTVILRVASFFLCGTHDGHVASSLIVIPRHRHGTNRFLYSAHIRPTPVLYAAHDEDDVGNDANLDQQKLALENMLKNSSGTNSSPPENLSILTTSRKQRLEREIGLLRQLDPDHPENNSDYSDMQNQEFVVAQLWSLWYGERGPLNEMKLREIEETLVDPSQWARAENQYLDLIREHCSTDGSMDSLNLSNWVEPANRLATLLFLMGRLKESKQWCEKILSTKPWHIGALSGVVMVCLKMGDREGVLKYSLMGMPNSSLQMRNARKEWVQQNARLAEKNLRRLEQLNRESYGKPDEGGEIGAEEDSRNRNRVSNSDERENEIRDDGSAWQ